MAKKAAKPKGQLGDWLDNVPEAVLAYADLNLIDAMRKHKISKVRIRNGEKFLVVEATDKIKYEKPEESVHS